MKRLSAILLLVSISGCTHTYLSMSQAERACWEWYEQGEEVSVTYPLNYYAYEIKKSNLAASKYDEIIKRFEFTDATQEEIKAAADEVPKEVEKEVDREVTVTRRLRDCKPEEETDQYLGYALEIDGRGKNKSEKIVKHFRY